MRLAVRAGGIPGFRAAFVTEFCFVGKLIAAISAKHDGSSLLAANVLDGGGVDVYKIGLSAFQDGFFAVINE